MSVTKIPATGAYCDGCREDEAEYLLSDGHTVSRWCKTCLDLEDRLCGVCQEGIVRPAMRAHLGVRTISVCTACRKKWWR